VPGDPAGWFETLYAEARDGQAVVPWDDRQPNPHLSFSAGTHFCLGAPLARLHGEVALSTLFTRLPGLAARTPPGITASVPIRQIDHFAITWQ